MPPRHSARTSAAAAAASCRTSRGKGSAAKTALLVAALRDAGVREETVRPCGGGEAWAYRSVLRATFDRRGQTTVAGFFGWGDQRPYNIAPCPIPHPPNGR